MELKETNEGDVAVLAPVGRIDSSNAKQFEEALLGRLTTTEGGVLVDLSELQYISSAGLRVVLLAAKQQQQKGRKFALCSPSPEILEVFEVSGFNKIIDIHQQKNDALAKF